jgi:zinc protease
MLALEDYRLPNGLRVVLNEDHSAPLVAVNLWYHVGSKNERPGRTGFAHLFEHMLFSGSEHVGNNEHFRYVQSVGGVLNGTTFFDRRTTEIASNYLALASAGVGPRATPAGSTRKSSTSSAKWSRKNGDSARQRPHGTASAPFESGYDPVLYTNASSADGRLRCTSLDDIREFFATVSPRQRYADAGGDFVPGRRFRRAALASPVGGSVSPSISNCPLNGER